METGAAIGILGKKIVDLVGFSGGILSDKKRVFEVFLFRFYAGSNPVGCETILSLSLSRIEDHQVSKRE